MQAEGLFATQTFYGNFTGFGILKKRLDQGERRLLDFRLK
jgi:hypothetical protein